MEKTMYDCRDELKRKKSSFTLDLTDSGKKLLRPQLLDPREGLLSSPDVGLLRLATPELERFLIQQQNTPTVLTPSQLVMTKAATEEQEAYARGFVDALLNMHRQRSPLLHSAGGLVRVDGDQLGSPSFVTLTPVQFHPDSLRNRPELPLGPGELSVGLTALPVMVPPAGLNFPPSNSLPVLQKKQNMMNDNHLNVPPSGYHPCASPSILHRGKESSQTVPVLDLTRSVSPIDMSSQERIKLERRREKNRNAAQKCRTRKIERIQRLEERVQELKNQNSRLAQTATEQREHVAKLKQQIVEHVSSGCQVMMLHDTM